MKQESIFKSWSANFDIANAMLVRGIILTMITDAVKREDWDMISLILDSWERVKIEPYIKAANEFLKSNPMEIIVP